jgi:uncharacterized membrane protein YkgB
MLPLNGSTTLKHLGLYSHLYVKCCSDTLTIRIGTLTNFIVILDINQRVVVCDHDTFSPFLKTSPCLQYLYNHYKFLISNGIILFNMRKNLTFKNNQFTFLQNNHNNTNHGNIINNFKWLT